MRLGINIDHVATLRQARIDVYPDVIEAARAAFNGGADGITVHLREDRRHINDMDVLMLRKAFPEKYLNLEMAADFKIAEIAIKIHPDAVCIVPERRKELTTEGGLNILKSVNKLARITSLLQKNNIKVSLFINAERDQIFAASQIGANAVELHTGAYGEASDIKRKNYSVFKAKNELRKLISAGQFAKKMGLTVNAGHGLTYKNVCAIAKREDIFSELNIGHNVIARAVFVGLTQAVQEMSSLMTKKHRSS